MGVESMEPWPEDVKTLKRLMGYRVPTGECCKTCKFSEIQTVVANEDWKRVCTKTDVLGLPPFDVRDDAVCNRFEHKSA